MGRSPCCEKVGLKRGRWTSDEDEILTNYIQANGEGSWRSLPKNAGLLRCGKSCRLRWINYLRADLKRGNITAQEEETIVKLHSAVGNRWSLIAAQLPGRTDNEIKNYWNSHLSRKIYSFSRTIKDTIKASDLDAITTAGQWERRGGRSRTSRSSDMKRHKLALMSPKNQVFDPAAPQDNTRGRSPKSSKDWTNSQPDEDFEMHGSCMQSSARAPEGNYDESGSTGEKSFNGIENYGCTSEREADEVLGPYEWLDNEIKRLTSVLLQSDQGAVDHPSGNHGLTTNGENGVRIIVTDQDNVNGVQKDSKNDDHERQNYGMIWSSSNTKFTDHGSEQQICNSSSPGNSGFDQEWVDQWELWDDSDKVFCWFG